MGGCSGLKMLREHRNIRLEHGKGRLEFAQLPFELIVGEVADDWRILLEIQSIMKSDLAPKIPNSLGDNSIQRIDRWWRGLSRERSRSER